MLLNRFCNGGNLRIVGRTVSHLQNVVMPSDAQSVENGGFDQHFRTSKRLRGTQSAELE
jgi:hypothetical protein